MWNDFVYVPVSFSISSIFSDVSVCIYLLPVYQG